MSKLSYSTSPTVEAFPSAIVWLIRLFALVALGVCGYLFLETVALSELPAGCGAGSSCEQVLNSPWSRWMRIPVSAPAAAVYFLLFASAVLIDPVFAPGTRRMGWRAMTFLATLSAASAVWFILVQKIYVHAFCPWCLAAHASGVTAAILVFFSARATAPSSALPGAAARRVGRPPLLWPFALLALLGVGALIGGQVLAESGLSNSVVKISKNGVRYDWRDFPMLGAPDAPHVILVMQDYTCPHCRRTHPAVAALRKRYGAQVAVVSAIVPMNGKCNPVITQTNPIATNACDLARIALAVWRAKPDAFDEMDQWMFSQFEPPTPDVARQHAAALVGESAFKAAEADPWVGRTLRRSVDLYRDARMGIIPKIVLSHDTTLSGEIDDPTALFQLTERELGIKPVG